MSSEGPISIDGAGFERVDGHWTRVPAPDSGATVACPPIPDGYGSIDGAWFRNIDGRLEPAASPIPASTSPGRPIPEGYVSVDGALFRAEADAEPADAEVA